MNCSFREKEYILIPIELSKKAMLKGSHRIWRWIAILTTTHPDNAAGRKQQDEWHKCKPEAYGAVSRIILLKKKWD